MEKPRTVITDLPDWLPRSTVKSAEKASTQEKNI